MENNKSEELAKLLGIEPERVIKYSIGDDIFTIQGAANKVNNMYFEIADRSPINDRCVSFISEIDKCVDFTNPSNFVKLIELKIDKYSNTLIRGVLNWYSHNELEDIYNRNDFIYKIIEYFADNEVHEYTKNQAKRVQWEY